MRVFHIIKVIGYLLQNAMMRRSKYDLSFHREDDGVWYVDFPDWPFAHHNLRWSVVPTSYAVIWLMANRPFVLISLRANIPFSLSGYGLLTKTYSNLFYGADYDTTGFRNFHRTVWICPVTLIIMGWYITNINMTVV